MAQNFGIPQYPVISPLAGLYDIYKDYKAEERQQAQDAYTKEKDKREFDTNKGFKERELTNSERSTQSTMDYHNAALAIQAGQLGATADYNKRHLELQADPNAPTNAAALMNARAAAARARLDADKYNDEMKWTNRAFGNPGGSGQSNGESSRLYELGVKFDNLIGTPPHASYSFNHIPGAR
jgi:hypothetical protein